MNDQASAVRFGAFELDERQRALRLDGRELDLQPRVFDFIAFLLRNRNRVVSKDELLDALWPDVIVVEGALQRVVSLARTALRAGDADQLIRTYPRHGVTCG
jgi:DNA-binding winged helix-turn-helix (wHTH) protein